MDSLTLDAVVSGMRNRLLPARLAQVFMPGPHEVCLKLVPADKGFVVLATEPAACGLYWCSARPGASVETSPFLERLRSTADGGALTGIDKEPAGRVLRIRLAGPPPMAKAVSIAAELFPPRPALFLLDADGIVLAAIGPGSKRSPAGSRYEAPPTGGGLDPASDAFAAELASACAARLPREWARELGRRCGALSGPAAAEAVHRANAAAHAGSHAELALRLGAAAREVLEEARKRPGLILFERDGREPLLSAVELRHLEGAAARELATPLDAADAYCGVALRAARIGAARRPVLSVVTRLRKKLEGAAAKVQAEIDHADGLLGRRRWGELILASGLRLKERHAEVRVKDFYDPDGGEVTLALDPASSLHQNAERFFRQTAKSERTLKRARVRLRELRDRANALEQTAIALERAENPDDVEEIAREVRAAGRRGAAGPPERKTRRPGAKQAPGGPFRFRSSDGLAILVGKGARSNDRLTFGLARPDDFFFHAADTPGAHVVLVNPARIEAPPPASLTEAASLAAYHSRRSSEGAVDVHYAQRKHVRKPPGAPAGLVTLREFQSVRVAPSARPELRDTEPA